MSDSGKSTPDDTGIAGPLAEIVRRGMETLIDVQKRTLEVAAQQSTVAVEAIAAGVYAVAEPSANSFLQIASDTVAAFVEAHNGMLDLVVRQSAAASGAVKGGGGFPGTVVAGMSDAVHVSIERAVAAQKALLEQAVRQHAAVMEAAKRHAGAAAVKQVPKAMDAFRHTMETFAEAQKKVLDLAAQQGNVVIDAVRDAHLSIPSGAGAQMADMARQGFEVFVDTQKRLLQLISAASAKAAAAGPPA
jgi:hypothetical protein